MQDLIYMRDTYFIKVLLEMKSCELTSACCIKIVVEHPFICSICFLDQ